MTETLTAPFIIEPGMRFDGKGLTLRPCENYAHPALVDGGEGDLGRVSLKGLTIDGLGQPIIGVWLQGATEGSVIEDVEVRHTGRSGIVIGSTPTRAHGVSVRGNTLYFCGQASFGQDCMGISVINAIDVSILSNHIINSPRAVNCEANPNTGDLLMNILIANNLIRTSENYADAWGMSVIGRPSAPAKWVSIIHNHLLGPTAGWLKVEDAESVITTPNSVWW